MTQHQDELNKIERASGYFAPTGAIIAGGAVTSVFTDQPINDVDFYFKSKKAFIEAVGMAYDESMWCVSATTRAITFVQNDNVIQLMHFDFFPTANDVFDAFDFTVCMGAYDLDVKEFVFHEDFLKHAAQRHLSFHSGTRYPYGSLLRVLKYQDKGYKIHSGDLLRIGLSLQKTPINSWEDLSEAIGGQYGERALIAEDQPYSLENALALYEKKKEIITDKPSESFPDNAYGLLEKVGITVTVEDGFNEDDIKWLKKEY